MICKECKQEAHLRSGNCAGDVLYTFFCVCCGDLVNESHLLPPSVCKKCECEAECRYCYCKSVEN
jgi:hypothetical protein